MCAASRRGSRCWRKTLALYGEAGPKRALCVGAGTKHQIISRTDSNSDPPWQPLGIPTVRLLTSGIRSCPRQRTTLLSRWSLWKAAREPDSKLRQKLAVSSLVDHQGTNPQIASRSKLVGHLLRSVIY